MTLLSHYIKRFLKLRRHMKTFRNEYKHFYGKLDKKRGFVCSEATLSPRLYDATAETVFDRDYLYHAAWAARRISIINPPYHTDFSSNLYLSAILSAYVPTRFYDYRQPDLHLSGLVVDFADLTSLSFDEESLPSISCLSVIEHIGLGRYGDSLDPDGDLKAVEELKRVTARGGSVLINVPLGKTPKIFFNAHRIYSKQQVMDMFRDFSLADFMFIHRDIRYPACTADPSPDEMDELEGGRFGDGYYAAGCFHFIKK